MFFFAAVALNCGYKSSDDAALSSSELVIGVSEGIGEGSEFGVGHLVNQITTETLIVTGKDGRASPRLAVSWAWERDDLRLRLKLRDDVVLHDGRRFDSQLAAEALAIAMARGANRAGYPALRDVTAAIPDGPFDLLLDLSRRSALLPEELVVLIDIPAGPYRPVRESAGEVELERFDKFYMGTPSILRVTLRSFDTLRTAWASLLRGEVDFVYDVPAEAVEFVRSDEVQISQLKRWYQFAIAFNSRVGPLQLPQIRRALNLSVDRTSLVEQVLQGAGTAAHGPLWPDYWAADRSISAYAFDPERAAALLDQAGFPIRPSADAHTPPARFRFTCLMPENFSVLERIAIHVQKNLFNVGVDVRFDVVPLDEFARRMATGQFEAAMLDMNSGPTAGRAYIFWASAQKFRGAYNVFGYENAEVERLFETLRTTRNEAAVRSATRRLQRELLDDPPALFLAWRERSRAIRREFTFPSEPGVDPVFSLWRWSRRPDTLAASAP